MPAPPDHGTRTACERGAHTSDNQGLCHWCGALVNPDWWEAYAGEPHPDEMPVVTFTAADDHRHDFTPERMTR